MIWWGPIRMVSLVPISAAPAAAFMRDSPNWCHRLLHTRDPLPAIRCHNSLLYTGLCPHKTVTTGLTDKMEMHNVRTAKILCNCLPDEIYLWFISLPLTWALYVTMCQKRCIISSKNCFLPLYLAPPRPLAPPHTHPPTFSLKRYWRHFYYKPVPKVLILILCFWVS